MGSCERFLEYVEKFNRPPPLAGRFSALTDVQLWRLSSARAGRVKTVDRCDDDAIAEFLGTSRSELLAHEAAVEESRAAHPGVDILNLPGPSRAPG